MSDPLPTIDEPDWSDFFLPPQLPARIKFRLRVLFGEIRNQVVRSLRETKPDHGSPAEQQAEWQYLSIMQRYKSEFASVPIIAVSKIDFESGKSIENDEKSEIGTTLRNIGEVLDAYAVAIHPYVSVFDSFAKLPPIVPPAGFSESVRMALTIQLSFLTLLDAVTDDECSLETRRFWISRAQNDTATALKIIGNPDDWPARMHRTIESLVAMSVSAGISNIGYVNRPETGSTEDVLERATKYRALGKMVAEWSEADAADELRDNDEKLEEDESDAQQESIRKATG